MKRKRRLIFPTVLNSIILVVSILGYIGTTENLIQFNSTDNIFEYAETERGRVILTLDRQRRVNITFHKSNAEVADAYLFSERSDVIKIICFIRYYCEIHEIRLKRTNSDLYGEYRLHTILYDVDYNRAHTKNANIDYEKDDRWYVTATGKIIGWLGF